MKRAARNKGLGFDITREQHEELLKFPCCYCAGVLNETGHVLDRMDSARGYLRDNVVTCCYACNRIKNDELTYAEMLVAMQAVLQLRKGGTCGS